MISSAIVSAIALCGATASAAALLSPPSATAAAVAEIIAPMPTPTPAPSAAALLRRDPAKETDPWVSVNDVPEAVTLTPVWTTDPAGKSSLKDPAPYLLTGSVFSFTSLGEPTTTTGDPPNPTATGKNGAGAFSRCFNKDGEHAPFCRPAYNSTVEPGNTYYITWDPDFYNKTSTNATYSLTVRLEQQNRTTHEWVLLKDFPDRRTPASQGYFALDVADDLLGGHDTNPLTVTLLQRPNGTDGAPARSVAYPFVVQKFKYKAGAPNPGVRGRTLTIALPVVFGAILLLVVGLCLWNRKTRRIELGNIMSRRSGRGYSGRRERRRRMLAPATDDADHDIPLGGGGFPDDGPVYRDVPNNNNNSGSGGSSSSSNRARRDSGGLDSLSASPVHEDFERQGTTGGRNVFRDEMDRQQNERRGEF